MGGIRLVTRPYSEASRTGFEFGIRASSHKWGSLQKPESANIPKWPVCEIKQVTRTPRSLLPLLYSVTYLEPVSLISVLFPS